MKLFFRYSAILLRSQMQYKASFFLAIIGQFLYSFSGFLALYFMFVRFSGVVGFTYEEVLLCYGVVLAAFSFAECFARGFDSFPQIISNGEFDRILVRPRGLVLQVLGSRMEFTRVGRLVQGVGMLVYGILRSGVLWTGDRIAVLCLMLLCGCILFAGIEMLQASISFFTIEGLSAMSIITYGIRDFGKYPFSIYGKGVLMFLTYVVPVALFQYYPLLYLLGRTDSLLYALCPVLALVFLLPCYGMWRFGVRHYKSTGS